MSTADQTHAAALHQVAAITADAMIWSKKERSNPQLVSWIKRAMVFPARPRRRPQAADRHRLAMASGGPVSTVAATDDVVRRGGEPGTWFEHL